MDIALTCVILSFNFSSFVTEIKLHSRKIYMAKMIYVNAMSIPTAILFMHACVHKVMFIYK
jgi:hypothetical protein